MIVLTYLGIALKVCGYIITFVPLVIKAGLEWRDVKRKVEAALMAESAGGKEITKDEVDAIIVEVLEAVGATAALIKKAKSAFAGEKK